ncbi:amidohydrolase family protein [Amycolatopsis sp. 195334CR]|uniref:amidohydrolase family protein n=1 Tax=Amycolatopsis sp. 195334CR TaxID=2814588 RepID=UPI001A8E54FD|nr:amidohydrolase family protein [Amycolatopsis sp. 195334CR]MBN6038295.1 amidohydrolase family protein [Amycolatopsis sp. 195334CR]
MLVDAHVHVVDFLQDRLTPAAFARKLADAGVDRAVVCGLPVKKKWPLNEPRKPGYYLDGNAPCQYYSLTDELVASLHAELPDDLGSRVAPTMCGFDPTDRLAIEHVELVWSRHDTWRGIGEVMLRHDDLTNLTRGENPCADHLALDPVFDFAAEREVPIAIHHDSSSPGRPGEHEYVDQLAGMLRRHPRTAVVWCHAGVSRRVEPQDQGKVVADLLEQHPRLHVDLSWALLDHILDDGRLVPRWRELVVAHPDRFVCGSDIVGPHSDWKAEVARLAQLLDDLPSAARQAVAGENALRLWWQE